MYQCSFIRSFYREISIFITGDFEKVQGVFTFFLMGRKGGLLPILDFLGTFNTNRIFATYAIHSPLSKFMEKRITSCIGLPSLEK